MKAPAAKAKAATVTSVVNQLAKELAKLIHLEPTCIKCGCTEYAPCDVGFGEGCSWTFVNKKTNEGLCSACFRQLS